MSHVARMEIEVTNLKALARAAVRLGGTMVLDQQTHQGYYGAKEKCDHAITFPGCKYEVGVVKLIGRAQESYALQWDSYESALAEKMGGHGGNALIQAYGVEVTIEAMMLDGASLIGETVRADGVVELEFGAL